MIKKVFVWLMIGTIVQFSIATIKGGWIWVYIVFVKGGSVNRVATGTAAVGLIVILAAVSILLKKRSS